MATVQILDLGMNVGEVSQMFIDVLRECRVDDWRIDGFEPHPVLFEQCRERFQHQPHVQVHPLGLSRQTGQRRLYHAANNVGHSVYVDKLNVSQSEYELIQCVRLSDWIYDNLDLAGSCNILKVNIEGAEWEVYRDLVDRRLIGRFDLLLGTPDDEDDIHKVASLKGRYDEYRRFLRDNNVQIRRYSDYLPERNFDLADWLGAVVTGC